MKQQIVAIKKFEENKNKLTVHEAENLAGQIKRLTKEAEEHFKTGESKLKTCAPLIERMIECKGEGGKNGWQLIGYKSFKEWSLDHLDYKRSYTRIFYKAALAYIELRKSQEQEIVEFLKDAPVAHLAAIGGAPEGERVKAVKIAKEMVEEIGEDNLSERLIGNAVEKLKPVGVEEEKLKTLTSHTLTATNKEWIKVKHSANTETLSSALSYWKKQPQSNNPDRQRQVECRIKVLSDRIEYLSGKPQPRSSPTVKKVGNRSGERAERQDEKKNLALEFSVGGLLSIEDPETLSNYIKVVPCERIFQELENAREERDRLMDNLDTAALEIVSLNQEINNLKQENQILRRNQKVIRSEWELEIVNVVGGLNGRKTLVLN